MPSNKVDPPHTIVRPIKMNGESSTRAASRKSRVYVFRKFILEKYSHLLQGDIVLDCAGGKGDLSWLLVNADNIHSVVLDPRQTKNKHIIKSINYLRGHPEEAKKRAVPGLPTYQPLAELLPKLFEGGEATLDSDFESPRHIRILVDNDLVEAVRYYRQDYSDKEDAWNQYWHSATAKAKDITPLGYKEDDTNTGGQITAAQEALHTILSAKLVVGFHPDQATDPCIDLANELDISFCLVPCCVFPSEFPDRKLADGSRVRCYSELIQYLQEKHAPSIKTDALDFHFTETAKNLVLYS